MLYWKHPIAPDIEEKAASVLWYYERAEFLQEQGEPVFCVDEKTQIQALSPPLQLVLLMLQNALLVSQ